MSFNSRLNSTQGKALILLIFALPIIFLQNVQAQSGFSVPGAVWGTPPAFERTQLQTASGGNNVYVVWNENEVGNPNFNPEVYFVRSTDGGRTFGMPVNLSLTPGNSAAPRLAASGSNVYVLWSEVAGDFFRVSTDGGQNFSAAQNLTTSSSIQSLGNGGLTASGSNVYVSWQKVDSSLTGGFTDTFVARSFDNGASFSAPMNVSLSPTTSSSNSRIAASGSNVYVAWVENNSTGSDIHYCRSTDNAVSFEAVKNLSNNDGSSLNVTLDAEGTNVWVAWNDRLSPSLDDILYTRSTDGGVDFEAVRNLSNNTSPSTAPAVKGKGNRFYLAWSDGTQDYPTNTAEEIYLLSSNNSGADFDSAQNISLSTSVRSRTAKLGLSDTAVSVYWLEGSFRDVYYSYLGIAAATPPPSLLSVAPGSIQQNQTVDLTLTGSDFKDGATLQFSGAGITVNSVHCQASNELVANVSVALSAETGPRDVLVTNPDAQSSSLPGGLSIISASALDLIEIAGVDVEQGAKQGGFPGGNSSYKSLLAHLKNAETALLRQPADTLEAINQMDAFYIKLNNMLKGKKPEITNTLYSALFSDYAAIMKSLGGNPKPSLL